METQIVSRVAELIRNPKATKKEAVEKTETKDDRIEISKEAKAFFEKSEKMDSELEKMQYLKVQSLQSRVQSGNYQLNEEMVDDIAEKILKML